MLVTVLLISALSLTTARVYERCELARDLITLGINRDDVATWVCIAYHESRFDTAARNPHSGDHGLLQISELYWCGPGKACGAPCSAFRDEDIADDVRCALRIHEEHTRLQGNGFLAWVVYPQHCKHNAKKYLADCEHTKSVTKSNEARSLKVFEKNITSPPPVTYNYAEGKKPDFLVISDLFKAHISRDFEQNYYENKKRVNDVKTSVSGRNLITQFTTPRTVTTADPALKGIKPPTPRKIESNQFRRRMYDVFGVPNKYNYNSDTQISSHSITSGVVRDTQVKTSNASNIDSDFLSHNIFINRARALSNFNLDYIESNTQKPITTSIVEITKKIVTTQRPISTPVTSSYISARRGKTKYTSNLSNFADQSYMIGGQNNRPSNSVFALNSGVQRNRGNVFQISSTKDYVHTGSTNSSINTISSTQKYETTKSLTKNAPSLSRSSSPFSWNGQTTRPRFIWNTPYNSQSSSTDKSIITSKPSISGLASAITPHTTPPTSFTVKTPAQTSARPTQSIFDLYLNPTRATIKPFQFAPFKDSPFKLRIFSGGTTTPPPSFLRKSL